MYVSCAKILFFFIYSCFITNFNNFALKCNASQQLKRGSGYFAMNQ